VLGEYVSEIWGWNESTQRQLFAERLAQHSRQIIEVNGDRVGVLEVEDRPEELHLALVELSPPWQGRGLGASILEALVAQAARSKKPLSLHVLSSNPRARSFYERAGMYVVDAESTRFLMRTSRSPFETSR
jgi:ribosomal protein S18 acetylase RimI-like enzyme